MLGRDLVEELPEGLVALAPVADVVGHAGGAGGDVGRPVLLAGVVQVAGLGGVQAVVPFRDVLHCKRRERQAVTTGLGAGAARTGLCFHCDLASHHLAGLAALISSVF